MRIDMNKVIVERPRKGGHKGEYGRPRDLDDSPRQEGLRRRHRDRKWLNENLRPLERFLAAQVDRPWDKVYSEICDGIDRRSTVQKHILQHVGDFVAVRVRSVGGSPYYDARSGKLQPLAAAWAPELYVDPHSGLLRRNTARLAFRKQWKQARLDEWRQRIEPVREDRRILDATTQLHRIDGVWYRVELARVPPASSPADDGIDAIRRTPARLCPARDGTGVTRSNRTLFGDETLYASSKRQLRTAELRQHGLVNDASSGNDTRAAMKTGKSP